MKIKHLFFSALTLLSNSAYASRSFYEAQTTAKKILSQSDIYLADVKTLNEDTVCYTFKGKSGGYAVISADTRVPAVLAYSEKGGVYPELPTMIDVFAENVGKNQHENMQISTSAEDSELRAFRITDKPIAPLLKNIKWGQYAPFNLNVPVLGETNAPAGCVATALAQILCYYRYPNSTLAEIPAYTTATEGISMESVAKGTVIDWDNILDDYTNGYSEKNATAVSNLMSAVCASTKIDFGEAESSSSVACVEELVNFFGYDRDLIKISYRNSYSLEDWSQIIYDELKNNRPVMMSGYTVKSGHRFLCDGIDKNGLFHINWGWNGDADGYYDLALLNPNTSSEAGASSSTDGYSKGNFIIYGIQPDNGVADVVEKGADVDAIGAKYQIENGKIYLFFSYCNLSPVDKTVYLASGYVDDNGKVVKTADIGNYILEPYIRYDQLDSYPLDFSSFKEGDSHKIGLIESADGKNWRPTTGFEYSSYEFYVENGLLDIVRPNLSASLEVKDFSFLGQYAHGTIHLKNDGRKEYYEPLYLMTNSVNKNPMSYSYVAYVTAEANDSNDVDFKFIPTTDTVYYWVMDATLKEITNGVMVRSENEQKLSASVKIDTTAYGTHICRVTLKNEGKTYYENDLRTILFYDGGQTKLTSYVYLEPGKNVVTSFDISSDITYLQYYVYDYNAETISSGKFGDDLLSDTLMVDFECGDYNTNDKVVNGNLIVRNETSEPLDFSYTISLITSDLSEEEMMLDVIDVNVGPHSLAYIPLSLFVGRESCTLKLLPSYSDKYLFFDLVATPVEDAVDNVLADANKLAIWTDKSALVVETADDASLQITASNGCVLASRRLCMGERLSLNLPAGIYIVNGQKVLVK
ncbi:MAG: C10 family peptidase [Bacteroidales bacterium]|nr:C10 family peptidase [Candidatus Scybalocola fimicaballi]